MCIRDSPVAVRMVYETAHAVNIPIIGMGGITNAADAIETVSYTHLDVYKRQG